MNRYQFNTSWFANNCGILEVGNVFRDSDDYEVLTPTDDEWYDAILADGVHIAPIVVFSYNDNQVRKDSDKYNIYHFGEWLKEKGETFTVSSWSRNGDNRIKLVVWTPSAKFKEKVRKADLRFQKESQTTGHDSY